MLTPKKFAFGKQTPHNETKRTVRFSLVPFCTTLRSSPEMMPLRVASAAGPDVQTDAAALLFRSDT